MIQITDNGQVTNYIYNVKDRLERVEDGSGSLISQYYYDPFGRRLWKEVNGVRTYFVYADEGLVAEVDAAGNVTKSYGYRPGSIWTTDPLFMKVDGQYYFYQNDHLGTPQKLTAVNGAVVWSAKYSSFGEVDVDHSSTITNNLRFPGQYYDQESGLHYNQHRYYDPKNGRYFRTDPIGLRGGINLFAYTFNNPINKIDPKGLEYSKRNITPYDIDYGGPGSWAPPPAGAFGDQNSDCEKSCDQSWAECYTNCINTLVPFNALKSFIYSNMIANAGYYLSGGVTSITIAGEVIVIAESPVVLTGAAGAGAAAIGTAGLWVGGSIAAWVVGASYGCMISCSIDSCGYK